jgi:hypothetical protein
VEVASRLGGSTGQSVLDDARDAFVHAMGHAVLAGAAVALVGALFALVWLPARAPGEQKDDAAVPPVEPRYGETLTRPRSSVDAAVRTFGS